MWGLLLAVGLILVAALDCGYRLGGWRFARNSGEKEAPVGAMVASILALLAFVLGFTFSLAASQFDARRQAVLEEANAIGTTYLRTRLLPDPQRSEIARMLREYVNVRVEGIQTNDVAAALTRSETLHQQIWTQAMEVANKSPDSIMTGLFIQSLNDVIDLHAKRVQVGIRSRIPIVIWAGLISLAIVGMAAVGYQAGLAATRRTPVMLGLVVAFSLVILLVVDLDRSHEGLLRVSQQALVDLQKTM
jgi:hypothetical protein